MAQKPIIAIVGATGMQGRGLARALARDSHARFMGRALTRSPTSEKARALTALGFETVAADLDDRASLRRAFEGAHGAFCVTNYFEYFSPERELAQAENLAVAAAEARVSHVIWSTLEDTRRWVPLDDQRMPTLMGRYKVPHLDAKGEADGHFRQCGVPTTFLLTSFYWENLSNLGMGPKPDQNGRLTITFPMGDKKLPGIAVEDIGACALAIFARGAEWIGKTVGLAGEHVTGAEMAASLTRGLGRAIRYQDVSPEAYRSLGFQGADDIGNMFQFMRDFNDVFCAARDPSIARSLHPALQTFDAWLKIHKDRIPLG